MKKWRKLKVKKVEEVEQVEKLKVEILNKWKSEKVSNKSEKMKTKKNYK